MPNIKFKDVLMRKIEKLKEKISIEKNHRFLFLCPKQKETSSSSSEKSSFDMSLKFKDRFTQA
jgi:hypothetical protein